MLRDERDAIVGSQALLMKKVIDLFDECSKRALDGSHHNREWRCLGYEIVAPAAIGVAILARRIAEASSCESVHFLARDGLVFKRAYDRLFSGPGHPRSRYVWCSRRCLCIAAASELNSGVIDLLLSGSTEQTPLEFLSRLNLDIPNARAHDAVVSEFGEPNCLILPKQNRQRMIGLLNKLRIEIGNRARFERVGLLQHLADVGLYDGPAIVIDLGWHGSLQRLLIELGVQTFGRRPDIGGVYLGTFNGVARMAAGYPMKSHGLLFDRGAPTSAAASLRTCVPVVELLFSAPEHGINHVELNDGDPSPKRIEHQNEVPRIAIAQILHTAVDDCASKIGPDVAHIELDELADMVLRRLTRLLRKPTPSERKVFVPLTHADGYGSSKYLRMIETPLPHLSPSSQLAAYDASLWRRSYLLERRPSERIYVGLLVALRYLWRQMGQHLAKQ